MRSGLGPIFEYEWLTTTRKWQLYALRALFVMAILVGMIVVWNNANRFASPTQTVSLQTLAKYGESLYEAVVSIELTLVLLAAPAATAGAICLDKARGTLDHMLATDLSNAEIVLGKIGVRLVPVLGLIACVLPLTALTSLLGGIDPLALFGSFMTSIASAALGCSLGVTLSVWGRKTHEVLMTTYLVLVLWLISPLILLVVMDFLGLASLPTVAPTLWKWIECSNPYYLAFAPYSDPGKVGPTTYFAFLVICLAFSTFLLTMATLRIRGVALRQAGSQAASPSQHWLSRCFNARAWWPALPWPVTRREPSSVAGMASIPAIAVITRYLDAILSPRSSLARAFAERLHQFDWQSRNNRNYEHVSCATGIIALERECRNKSGRRARPRQPRRFALHTTVKLFDPHREMVRILSSGSSCTGVASSSGRHPRGSEWTLD